MRRLRAAAAAAGYLGAAIPRDLGAAAWLLSEAVAGMPGLLLRSDRLRRRRTVTALAEAAILPLPVLLSLACLVGFSVALVFAGPLRPLLDELQIVGFVQALIARQVVPLVVGILVAGQSGVALAVRLGTMAARGEMDALAVIGLRPARYVLAPTLLAFVAAAAGPPLVAIAAANLTAALVLQWQVGIPAPATLRAALDPESLRGVAAGLLRTESFALLAFAIAALEGSRSGGAPAELSAVARRTFVATLLGVFAAAAAFSWFEL